MTAVEIAILNTLTDTFGDLEGGYQERAMADAVSKLVGLARQFKAARTLREWDRSGAAFARMVDKKGF